MTRAERRALLGDAMVSHVQQEALRAAENYPPGDDVISALRPVLTANVRRPARKKKGTSVSAPIAA